MHRLVFALAVVALACGVPPQEPAERRPNVLLILTDQQERNSMSCAGNRIVETPHFDRIAREGVRFTRCYQQSPVCVPSRISLQTALYTPRHGSMANGGSPGDDLSTVAQEFEEAGYATGFFGKMHMPRRWARAHGWGAMKLTKDYQGYLDQHGFENYLLASKRRFDQSSNWWTGTAMIPEEHTFAAWATSHAIDFIDWAGDVPWHVTVSYYGPHPPWTPPEPYDAMYDPASIELPPQKVDEHVGMPFSMSRSIEVGMGMPDSAKRNMIAKYYGLVSQIDDHVGRLLEHLEERELLDDTVVVMTSDHGEMLGSHHFCGKGFLFESNVGVALLVRYPQLVPGGRVSNAIVEGIDVPQTLLDLAGLPLMEDVDGRSLEPLLTGETDTHRTYAHSCLSSSWDRAGYKAMVCNSTHKLMWYHADAPEPQLLFDMEADPHEHHNVIDDPQHADARRELVKELERWHGDMGYDPDAE